jgi:hypothetical protein
MGLDRISKWKMAQGGVHHAPVGYTQLVLMNAGPNPEGFFGYLASEPAEPMRKLAPARRGETA